MTSAKVCRSADRAENGTRFEAPPTPAAEIAPAFERAAMADAPRQRGLPADRYQFSPGRGIQIRNTAQQGNRIWMPGIGEHFAYRSLFHQTARVHHRNAVGMARDDTQVMRNEHDRHAGLTPKII